MAPWLHQTLCLFAAFMVQLARSGVIELDESFQEVRGSEPWLVEFYAPWCGHCRRLEPVYHQVWVTLRHTSVRVAKIDATRFPGVASDFDVRGYPTIKFIYGDKVYTHRGDRSKEAIVEFAKRAKGPQVRPLPNTGKFNDALSDLSDQVFFVYIGPQDPFDDILTKYTSVAEKYAVLAYFFSGEKKILPKDVHIKEEPTILVFKDGKHFEYTVPVEGVTKESLDKWVNSERYAAFPRISGGSLNEMADIEKMIVMIVIDEDETENPHHQRFKVIGENIAKLRREEFHSEYQFLWTTDAESINSITMGHQALPTVVVLDPETQFYYQPEIPMDQMTQPALEEFLHQIKREEVPAYGGTGILQRFKRVGYDLYMTVWSVYETSGWLALVVFGIPTFVISIVCYALCCMEPFDDSVFENGMNEDEDGQNEEAIEKDAEQQALLEEEEPVDEDGHIKKE